MGDDGRALARLEAIEHDPDDGVPRGGPREEVPRDGVGVARRRGDEDPQVRRTEQLGPQPPVLVDDGVDVRGVEQREPPRDGRMRDEADAVGRPGSRTLPAREPRQHPLGGEPGLVVRVVHQDGRARRRPQHARRAHHSADQGVDESRLAGPRRAADHGQERRAPLPHARQEVVVEVGEQASGMRPVLLRPGQAEGQAQLPEGRP